MRNYQTLEAWKMSMALITCIYSLTKKYPREELYSLTSQTRRAAISIAANIAEGMGRQHRKDTLQFLFVARGSIYELDALLHVGLDIEIIGQSEFEKISLLLDDTYKLLNGLINYWKRSELS